MTDRPILFSGPMVRALLDGRKTQTRRIAKLKPGIPIADIKEWQPMPDGISRRAVFSRDQIASPIYAHGDRLWVRESIGRRPASFFGIEATNGVESAYYKADDDDVLNEHEFNICPWWKHKNALPGIHMPRRHSRLTLTVTDVRIQRLQDMSEEDAVAEGVMSGTSCLNGAGWFPSLPAMTMGALPTAKDAYRVLWDSINADRGFSWDANPWIVAITFTVERRNIDEASS